MEVESRMIEFREAGVSKICLTYPKKDQSALRFALFIVYYKHGNTLILNNKE
jgi:hypothetical protein